MSSKNKREFKKRSPSDNFKRIKDPGSKKKREKIKTTDWE